MQIELLKTQLQGELQRAWTAGLIEGAQGTACIVERAGTDSEGTETIGDVSID